MQITMIPQFSVNGYETVLSVDGAILTVDGVPHNLSADPEPGAPFFGIAEMVGGEIHCTVVVQLGITAAPDQTGDPWIVSASDGPVTIPAARVSPDENLQA